MNIKVSDYQIMIVDDVMENLHILHDCLSNAGYKVREANSGEIAISSINLKAPDLILLDIKMPKMDGFEVCRKLKENELTSSIPIIFLSALTDTEDKVRAFDLGGVDYITKPFEEKEVLSRVQTHLENYRMKHHLEEEVKKRTYDLNNANILLARKEEQYRNLVETMQDGYIFYSHNLQGKLTYVSPSIKGVTGYSQDEFIEHFSEYIIDNKINKIAQEAIDHALHGQRQIPFNLEIIHKNGKKCWLEVTEYPVLDNNMNIVRLEGIGKDITEKKALEEKLQINEDILINQSKHASMGELIGMIAHQWKQPISIISMAANNIKVDLELETLNTDELAESMDDITNMTQHLANTINDFRSFFKPNKEKELSRISSVIEKAKSIVGKSLENSNIKLDVLDNTTSEINIYDSELVHVFINIINNAKDVLLDNKISEAKVKLTASEDEKIVKVLICDNAGGIPDDLLDKIGTRYFTTKEDKGTGLGIYMSKVIIENRMNGNLSWYNTEIGACFCIEIPKE